MAASCQQNAGGSEPNWFRKQAAGSWQAIAGPGTAVGAGGTIDAVKPGPADAVNNPGNGHNTLTTSWTGATHDPVRKEYLMVANGGHADYTGNEAYALKLNQAEPKWVRLNSPTQAVDFNAAAEPSVYSDGRSKAMHTAGTQHYHNGKVWFTMQNSVTSGAGGSVASIVSFNRNQYPDALTGTAAVPYAGDPNPWVTNYGQNPSLSPSSIKFCLGAIDRKAGRTWMVSGEGNNGSLWTIDTASGVSTRFQMSLAASTPYKSAFMAFASDLRLLVMGCAGTNSVVVKNVDNGSDTGVVQACVDDGFNWDVGSKRDPGTPSLVPGVNKMPGLYGTYNNVAPMSGCYHAASQSIYVVDPFTMGGTVRKLHVPTWTWTTISAVTPTGMVGVLNGCWTKVQLIEDVDGLGHDALVYCESTTGATYVFKVPG